MDRFHEYLYGGRFNMYTDNNPLTYILTSAKLDACGQRWVASLASYDFGLFYKTGKTNVDADALSHIPRKGYHELESLVVKALLKSSQETDWTDYNGNSSEIVCKSCQIIPDKITTEQWRKEQANDEIISQVVKAMENSLENHAFSSELARQMFRHRNRLIRRHGLLYKKLFDINVQEERMQFVLLRRYWSQALEACHDNVGHLGIERTLSLLRDWFYWPNMAQDVETHVKSCPRCLRFKKLPERATLNPIEATRPLELVHIDYLTIDAPENSRHKKDVNVLIVTDHIT